MSAERNPIKTMDYSPCMVFSQKLEIQKVCVGLAACVTFFSKLLLPREELGEGTVW